MTRARRLCILTFLDSHNRWPAFASAEETAKDTYRTLVAHNLLRTDDLPPTYRFQATGNAQAFGKLARRFLGPEVVSVENLPNTKDK
mgnify:CR=1 FL=1